MDNKIILETHKIDQVITNIEKAWRTAKEFTKLYYETIDKKRHGRLKYLEEMLKRLLVWNGNGITGNENIQNFVTELPPSEHSISTMDAQPILASDVSGQLTFILQVSGSLRYKGKPSKTFQQNFVITAEGDKWKIVSACFRIQDPAST